MRSVVVTGIGVVTRCGQGIEQFWEGLDTPVPVGGNWGVHDFDLSEVGNPKEVRRLDKFTQFGMAATAEAWQMAGLAVLDEDESFSWGVVIGNTGGGWTTHNTQISRFQSGQMIQPNTIPMTVVNAVAGNIAIKYKIRGLSESISVACASGTHSIVRAWELIASGRCDAVIAGGAESPLVPYIVESFVSMGGVSAHGRLRPFADGRDGFMLSEGAGILILEEESRARARGAEVLGYVLGGWYNCDAYHMTAPRPDATVSFECMRNALQVADVEPNEVSWINAHAAGTPLGDAAEIEAARSLFAQNVPPILSIKGATGHCGGASGSIEAVATIKSFLEMTIPPTLTDSIDPEFGEIDIVTQKRPYSPAPVISSNFGVGGQNASVVLAPQFK